MNAPFALFRGPVPHPVAILACCLAALPAVGRSQAVPKPGDPLAVPAGRLAAALAVAGRVWFDRQPDGSLWVAGSTYKARFDRQGGMRFVTVHDVTAPEHTLDLRLHGVALGGEPLTLAEPTVTVGETAVDIDHGRLLERYLLAPTHVEQTFRFTTLPRRERLDLYVEVAAGAGLAFAADDVALSFADAEGRGISVGRAVAIDGAGRRRPLPTTMTDGRLHIEVPAQFVAEATLPLTIDPVVRGIVTVSAAAQRDHDPDVAYDASTGRYVVVWERDVSATDSDVWSAELDDDLQLVAGSVAPIDISTDCWERPKVANDSATDRFLVVAQRSLRRSSPFAIWGRTRTAGTLAVSAPLAIADASQAGHAPGDKYSPDVGGDPSGEVGTYFAVVWQRETTASNHDIHAKQVTSEATPRLRNAAPTVVDDSPAFEFFPTISKSNGGRPQATQRWFLGWVRQKTAVDWDVHGSVMTWDGRLPQPPLPRTFVVDDSDANDHEPTVSSPTDEVGGERFALYAWQRGPGGGPTHLQGIVFDQGVGDAMPAPRSPAVNLNLLDGAPVVRSPRTPSADCDGVRFAVAYAEDFSAVDVDTRISTFHYLYGVAGSGALGSSEARATLGYSTSREQHPEITAVRSGGGGALRSCVVWDDDRGGGADAIEAALYEGYQPGGFAWFGTGCSGLGLAATGTPALGGRVTVSVQGRTGNTAQLWGARTTPLTLCNGCTWLVDGLALPDPVALAIPADMALFGGAIDVQGVDVNPGSCAFVPVDLRLTRGLEITIR